MKAGGARETGGCQETEEPEAEEEVEAEEPEAEEEVEIRNSDGFEIKTARAAETTWPIGIWTTFGTDARSLWTNA